MAVREKYAGRRLIAVFEPRSNSSRRNIFQETYVTSFDKADMIFIPEPPLTEKIPDERRFSSAKLVEDLGRKGLVAYYFEGTDNLIEALQKNARSGDVSSSCRTGHSANSLSGCWKVFDAFLRVVVPWLYFF